VGKEKGEKKLSISHALVGTVENFRGVIFVVNKWPINLWLVMTRR
jgi:hypothetical protein